MLFALCLAVFFECVSFGERARAATHTDHSGWTVFSEGSSIGSESATDTNPARYYLANDVTLSDKLEIEGYVIFCLNGYILQGNGKNCVIEVGSLTTLVLEDCSSFQTGKVTGGDSGIFVNASHAQAKLIMNGGNIMGNSAMIGGGVYSYGGETVINGGKIFGNGEYYNDVESGLDTNTLIINGGEIEYVHASSLGTIKMTGGYLLKSPEQLSLGAVQISGGYFGEKLKDDYIANGYALSVADPSEEGYKEGYPYKVVDKDEAVFSALFLQISQRGFRLRKMLSVRRK